MVEDGDDNTDEELAMPEALVPAGTATNTTEAIIQPVTSGYAVEGT